MQHEMERKDCLFSVQASLVPVHPVPHLASVPYLLVSNITIQILKGSVGKKNKIYTLNFFQVSAWTSIQLASDQDPSSWHGLVF